MPTLQAYLDSLGESGVGEDEQTRRVLAATGIDLDDLEMSLTGQEWIDEGDIARVEGEAAAQAEAAAAQRLQVHRPQVAVSPPADAPPVPTVMDQPPPAPPAPPAAVPSPPPPPSRTSRRARAERFADFTQDTRRIPSASEKLAIDEARELDEERQAEEEPLPWVLRGVTRLLASTPTFIGGAVAGPFEDVMNLMDSARQAEALRVHRLAEEARFLGKTEFVYQPTTVLQTFDQEGNPYVHNPVTLRVDDVLLSDEEIDVIHDETSEVETLFGGAYEHYHQELKRRLSDDPDFFSLKTADINREALGTLINQFTQLILELGGVTESEEERKAKSFTELIAITAKLKYGMGKHMGPGMLAAIAYHIRHPITSVQADAPLMILDFMIIAAAIKAAVRAGSVRLGPDGMRILDQMGELGERVQAMLDTSGAAERYQRARASLADPSAMVEKRGTEGYNAAVRHGEIQGRAVENAFKQLGREKGLVVDAEGRPIRKAVELDELGLTEAERARYEEIGAKVQYEGHEPPIVGALAEYGEHPPVVPPKPTARSKEMAAEEIALIADATKVTTGDVSRILNMRAHMNESLANLFARDGLEVPLEIVELSPPLQVQALRQIKEMTDTGILLEDAAAHVGMMLRERQRTLATEGRESLAEWKAADRNRANEIAHAEILRQRGGSRIGAETPSGVWVETVGGKKVFVERPIEQFLFTQDAIFDLRTGEIRMQQPIGSVDMSKLNRRLTEKLNDGTITEAEFNVEWNRATGQGRGRGVEQRTTPTIVVIPRPKYTRRGHEIIGRTLRGVSRSRAEYNAFRRLLDVEVARGLEPLIADYLKNPSVRREGAREFAAIVWKRLSEAEKNDLRGKDIHLWGKERAHTNLQFQIEAMLEEAQSRNTPRSGAPGSMLPYNIKIKIGDTGKSVDFLKEVMPYLLKKNPKLQEAAVSEALDYIGIAAGLRHGQRQAQRTLVDAAKEADIYARRVTGGKKKVADIMTETARAIDVFEKSGRLTLPEVIRVDPASVRSRLRRYLDAHSKKVPDEYMLKEFGALARKYKRTPERFARDLKRMEARLGSLPQAFKPVMGGRTSGRYVDITDPAFSAARGLLRIGDDLVEKWRSDRAASRYPRAREVDVEPVSVGAGSIYVPWQLAESINIHARVQEAFMNPNGFRRWGTLLKAHATSRNPSTLKGNLFANVLLQTFRRGTPFMPYYLVRAGLISLDYARGGKHLGKDQIRMLDDLYASGVVQSGEVIAELNGINRTGIVDMLREQGVLSPTLAKIAEKIDVLGRLHERAYQLGDEIPKLEEGMRNYPLIKQQLSKLGEGKHIDLEVGPQEWVRVFKDKAGRFSRKDGSKWNDAELGRVLGRAAMQPGIKLFFNFLDIPNYAKRLKIDAGGYVAPFYSWGSKAIDIPFMKRGLLSEAYSPLPGMKTNDFALEASWVARRAITTAGIEGLADTVREQNIPEGALRTLREAMKWGRGETIIAINRVAKDRVEFMNLGSGNPWSQTLKLFRAGEWGFKTATEVWEHAWREGKADKPWTSDIDKAILYGFDAEALIEEAYKGLDAEMVGRMGRTAKLRELTIKKESGQLFGLKDALELAGATGGLLMDVLHEADLADKMDRGLDISNIARRWGGLLIGNLYSKGIDATLGLDPESSISGRWRRPDEIINNVNEDWVRYAIRSSFGWGWADASVTKKLDRMFKRRKKRFRAGIFGGTMGLNSDIEKYAAWSHKAADDRDAAEKSGNMEEQNAFALEYAKNEAMVRDLEKLKGWLSKIIDDEFDRARDIHQKTLEEAGTLEYDPETGEESLTIERMQPQ